MPDCGPLKSRMSEYVPNYDTGREAAQELMKLLTCDFEGYSGRYVVVMVDL